MSLVPVFTSIASRANPRPALASALDTRLTIPQDETNTHAEETYLFADDDVRSLVRETLFTSAPRDDLVSRLTDALLRTPLPGPLVEYHMLHLLYI